MANWRNLKLDTIAKERRDNYQPNAVEELPYIGLEHIEQDTLHLSGIGVSSDTISTKRHFYKNDILFGSLRPYFRKVVFPEFEGVCSTDITVLRAREDVDSRFLFYFVSNQDFIDYATNISYGTKMPRAPWRILKESDWDIPPFETQMKIGKILSEYDKLIENNTRRIQILEKMAQLVYREWFVHYRFPGHEQVKMVDSGTEFGEIPEGWIIQSLEDICKILSSGGTPARSNDNFWLPHEVDWFKTKELDDRFLFNSEEKISIEGLDNSSAKLYPPKTIVMAIYASPTVGRLGILNKEASFNQAAVGLYPDENICNSFYLFLKLIEMRDYFNNMARGAAQQNINVQIVKQSKVVVPNKQIISNFSEIINPLFNLTKLLQQKIFLLKETRDLLLPRLISGEVDVSDLDIEIA